MSFFFSSFKFFKAVLICFNLANEESLQKASFWNTQTEQYLRKPYIKLLIGCGSDRERKVRDEDIVSTIRAIEADKYVETSAKLMIGVNELFEEIALRLVFGPKTLHIDEACRKSIWMCLMLCKRSKCCWNVLPKEIVIILKKYVWDRRYRDHSWMWDIEEGKKEKSCALQ